MQLFLTCNNVIKSKIYCTCTSRTGVTSIPNKMKSKKFAVEIDLGVINVPKDYVQSNQISLFNKRKERDEFRDYDSNINDENFSSPSYFLKPEDKLGVFVYKQVVSEATSSLERINFLSKNNSIFTGPQGLLLVWEQKRDLLPKGFWYQSFDYLDNLWKDSNGDNMVPIMYFLRDDNYYFRLGNEKSKWDYLYYFLYFYLIKD